MGEDRFLIAFISGKLCGLSENSVIIDNNGIGYLIYVSAATLSKMPSPGADVKLFTHLNVKEDDMSLYGFCDMDELDMFVLLRSVSGIGPKVALSVLSSISPKELGLAIVTDDIKTLSKAQGIGKKIAERLVLELRDKIKTDSLIQKTGIDISPQQQLKASSNERQDAVDALLALGHSKSEAVRTVMEVAEEGMATDVIIRMALKRIHGK